MASMTLAYGATSMAAALSVAVMALVERYGMAPIPATQGTAVPFAGQVKAAAHAAHTSKNLVDRKADGWVPPRGRTL